MERRIFTEDRSYKVSESESENYLLFNFMFISLIFSEMSCHKPLAIRICTKKTQIQDISITNSTIKVLNLSSLTSASMKSDGRVDQKYILFFESFFGEAPITFTKFFGTSLVLGFADGSLVIFHKCPSKSLLLEEYERIPPTLTSSPIKTAFLPFLTVHQNGNCYEFVNLKENTILTVPDLKVFLFIEEKFKLIFITITGKICISDTKEIKEIASVSASDFSNCSTTVTINNNLAIVTDSNYDSTNAHLLLNVNSESVIVSLGNRIFIISVETDTLISSFTLQFTPIELHLIASNPQLIELFALTPNYSQLFKLKIGSEIEIQNVANNLDIFGLFVNEFFYIVVTIDGIFVHDTLTSRLINKCPYPKYFLKYHNICSSCIESSSNNCCCRQVKISKLEGFKFLFIWGKSLAQIWDISPSSKKSLATTPTSSSKQSSFLGSKAIRKYTKYALNAGIQDYTDEKGEEDHLNHLRSSLNIDGLTEEELISYANLLSQENNSIVVTSNDPDDSELEMALKLSLIEM